MSDTKVLRVHHKWRPACFRINSLDIPLLPFVDAHMMRTCGEGPKGCPWVEKCDANEYEPVLV